MAPPKGFKHSAETRERIRATSLGRRHTPESKEKLRVAHTGKPKGPKTGGAKEAHMKAMQKLKGIPRSEEVRAKISAAVKGHGGYTDEVRQKMSEKARGHATVNFSGGQEGTKLAGILCPLGYVREHYLYYGEPVVSFGVARLRRRFIRLDFAHLKAKIDVELDGPSHAKPDQIAEDVRRDALLIELGWRVVRIRHNTPIDLTLILLEVR